MIILGVNSPCLHFYQPRCIIGGRCKGVGVVTECLIMKGTEIMSDFEAKLIDVTKKLADNSNWKTSSLNDCRGNELIVRMSSTTGEIGEIELNYCRGNDKIAVKEDEAKGWMVMEFGDCVGTVEVVHREKDSEQWEEVPLKNCCLGDIIFYKPFGSNTWESHKLGSCPLSGSILYKNPESNMFESITLGKCPAKNIILRCKKSTKDVIRDILEKNEGV